MSRQNYSVARVKTRTQDSVGKFERHIERKNEHYANMNVDLERTPMNIQYRSCGELTYNEMDVSLQIRSCLKKDMTERSVPDCFIVNRDILSKRENWKRIMST